MLWKQPQALQFSDGGAMSDGWTGLLYFIGSKTRYFFRLGSGCLFPLVAL